MHLLMTDDLIVQPPGLAQQLRLHPKLLRRVLRHFEQEQIIAREHRREAAKRRRRAGDPVPDAGEDVLGQGLDLTAGRCASCTTPARAGRAACVKLQMQLVLLSDSWHWSMRSLFEHLTSILQLAAVI